MKPPLSAVREYEKSKAWRDRSAAILSDKEVTCCICGRRRWKFLPRKQEWKRVLRFSCHHKRYDHIGTNEEINDLQIMCALCHTFCHDALRLRTLKGMWEEIAKVVEKYFTYEGGY